MLRPVACTKSVFVVMTGADNVGIGGGGVTVGGGGVTGSAGNGLVLGIDIGLGGAGAELPPPPPPGPGCCRYTNRIGSGGATASFISSRYVKTRMAISRKSPCRPTVASVAPNARLAWSWSCAPKIEGPANQPSGTDTA